MKSESINELPDRHRSARAPVRYRSVAQALTEAIAAGRYPVGGLLPAERELESLFGASRHAVREAVKQLRDIGLVTSRAGIGTIVLAREASRKVVLSMSSIDELLQFTKSTRMTLISKKEIIADDLLVPLLRCQPGVTWTRMELLRTIPDHAEPLGVVQVYVRPEYSGLADGIEELNGTVFSLLEKRYGVELAELEQDISALEMPRAAAERLGVKPGSPALRVIRHYYERDGGIPEISLGWYPGSRFSYNTRMRMNVLGVVPQVTTPMNTDGKSKINLP